MPVGDSRESGAAPGGRGPSLRWATTSFGIAVLVAVAYFLAALISYAFKFEPSGVVVVWAPAGVMLALLILMPNRSWPAAAVGGFAGNFFADLVSGHLVAISLAGATANILESLLAAWLVVRCCRRPVHLRTLPDVLGLVVVAAGLANAVTALLGAAVLVVGSTFTFAGGWFAWWIGDGVGMLVVAPLILAWTGVAQAPPKLRWPRIMEGAVLLGTLLVVAVLVIQSDAGAERILQPSPYMTFPLLLWAALRFGPAGAATATFAVAAVMAEQASRGLGAFVIAGSRPDQQVVEAYVYLVLAASTALIPAAVLAERTRLTRQLRQNEEQYRRLFERNPHPMWIFDPETLAFLAVNDAAVAQYGYDREEFASRTIRDIRPTEDLARLDRDLASDHRGLDIAGTWRHRKKDGTVIEVEITSHEIDWHGRRAKVVAALDVTERRRLQEQLVHSQKMETVGRLAGGIAHDFNNLLGVILGYSDLALQDLGTEDPRRGELEQIRSAAELAAGLTRQLLAFSRKQVVDRRVIDLNEILIELEPMLRPALRENVEFVVLPATGLWPVLADPGEIHQVVMNLAINARDAMPSGGKLALETANVELDAHYAERHFAVAPGDYVMLAVSDTGIGMDAETREHIFEPFFTLKEKGKGTGLGLATVYGIVEGCGGHVWVYSEPGRGTTFKVYLPRAAGAEGASLERSPTAAPGGSETVLVVEDSEGVRELIRTCLERAGYRVHVAASGEEALAAARENPERIHLVVTDVVLPGIGGRQLAAELSESRPQLRVLFVSGYTDNAIVHNQILDAGVAFLQKPFLPKELLRRVRAVLDAGEAPSI